MTEEFKLSLIICTRNRGENLKRTLDSVAKQDFTGGWELILVDNGSTDDTPNVIAEFAESLSCHTKILYEPNTGLSKARNLGLANSSGELAVFTDDDCYPAENFLTEISRCLEDQDIDFCCGRLLLFDPTDRRVTIQERNELVKLPAYEFFPNGLLHGANMAFRRESILGLKGFDERLGAGSPFKAAEDTDLFIRMNIAGMHGIYDPRIVVYHHHGKKTDEEVDTTERGYWVGRGASMAKCGFNPNIRWKYLRQWYWLLRKTSLERAMTEVWTGIKFIVRFGPSPRKIWEHPSESLRRDVS